MYVSNRKIFTKTELLETNQAFFIIFKIWQHNSFQKNLIQLMK